MPLREELDNHVQDFLHDYIHGYNNSKEQGLNLDYCTFDTIDAFLNDMEKLFEATAKEVIDSVYIDTGKDGPFNQKALIEHIEKILKTKQLARLAALLRGEES